MNRFHNNKEIAMMDISKCACSSIFYNSLVVNGVYTEDKNNFEYKHFSEWFSSESINLIKQNLCHDDHYYVAIIRDPLERIKSAYYTLAVTYNKKLSVSDFISCLHEALQQTEYPIDRHVLSQFKQYDHQSMDLFVHINDLNRYFSSIDIENVHINKSFPTYKKLSFDTSELLDLLKDDYDIYNDILNSDKLFK